MNARSDKHRKKKKIRWGRIIFSLVLLIAAAGGIYVYAQLNKGLAEAKVDAPVKNTEFQKNFHSEKPKDGKINILLLGSDSRGEKNARSDSLLIAQYDERSHVPKLVSIMRDSYVRVPGHGKQKINAAVAFGGPELLRQTIKENFDIDVNYYAIIDFQGFPKIVDKMAPDGIEVNVPHTMSKNIGVTLHKGQQKLDGKELLGYVRYRHDSQSDFGRVERQQEVLSKLKDQATSFNGIMKMPQLIGLALPYIDTNIDQNMMITVGKDFVTGQAGDIEKFRIPEDGTFENKRYETKGDVLEIDIDKNKEALKAFLEGN